MYVKLRNGARVLQWKPSKNFPNNAVCLCDWDGEYVTWVVDRERNAVWGHYFQKDLVAATKDYEGRK